MKRYAFERYVKTKTDKNSDEVCKRDRYYVFDRILGITPEKRIATVFDPADAEIIVDALNAREK
jgi:hypothetical protein